MTVDPPSLKVVAYTNPSAAAQWRLMDPFKYLRRLGVQAKIAAQGITEDALKWADVIVLQSVIDMEGIALCYAYQQEYGKKIVVETDDLMSLNDDNPHKTLNERKAAPEIIKDTMAIANMVTTTTPYLAEKLKEFNENVVVLPNYVDLERWQVPVLPNDSGTLRIGWSGSITHLKDLESVREPLVRFLSDHSNVRLVFLGDLRAKDLFKDNFDCEAVLGVPFDYYPTRLGGLRLDVGLAPLVDNEFNRCKSDIKTMEYGVLGIPCIASSVEPYLSSCAIAAGSSEAWLENLELLLNPSFRQDYGLRAKKYVTTERSLERNVGKWLDAYTSLV